MFPLDGLARQHHDRASTLLWIDDEVSSGDGAVRLLALEGFHVDCAASGGEGLTLAHSGTYDAIILDQRLPDMTGIDVLEAMRRSGLSMPVLLLTGYPEVQFAVSAGRLGAWDYRAKTLLLEENWTSVLHEMVRARRNLAAVGDYEQAEWLADALEAIPSGRPSADSDRVCLLGRAVLDPRPGSHVFATYCKAFNETVRQRPCIVPQEGTAAARIIRLALDMTRDRWPALARQAITTLETETALGHRPSEEEIARAASIHPSHLGRLIHSSTGLYFEEWRRALIMRPGLPDLAVWDEQVRQIGYRLGYEFPTQFTREFRELLGMTPTAFREVCAPSRRY